MTAETAYGSMNHAEMRRYLRGKMCIDHPKSVLFIAVRDGSYVPKCIHCWPRLPAMGDLVTNLDAERGKSVMSVAERALATRDERLAQLAVQDVKALIPGLDKCTDSEIKGFILYCKAVDADPWAKEIYLTKFDTASPAAIVLSLNWYLKRASHNPAYEAYQSGVVVERQGQYIDVVGSVTYPGDKLFGAWCKVYKRGARVPFERRVTMQEYNRRQASWNKIPATMIEKVAIVQGIRRAFPDEFGVMEEAELSNAMPVVIEGDVDEPNSPLPAALPAQDNTECPIHPGSYHRPARNGGGMMHMVEGETGPRGGKVWCKLEEALEKAQAKAKQDNDDLYGPKESGRPASLGAVYDEMGDSLRDAQEGTQDAPEQAPSPAQGSASLESTETPILAHVGEFMQAIKPLGLSSNQILDILGVEFISAIQESYPDLRVPYKKITEWAKGFGG